MHHPPLVEELALDLARVESAPARDFHQPRAFCARDVSFGQRRGHAAHADRVAGAIPDGKPQRGERRTPLEGPDRVLELERFMLGRDTLVHAGSIDHVARRQFAVGAPQHALLGGVEQLGEAAVGMQVTAVEVLEPDERRAVIEALGQERIRPGVAPVAVAFVGKGDERVPASLHVVDRLDLHCDALDRDARSIELAAEDAGQLAIASQRVGPFAVALSKRVGGPFQGTVRIHQGDGWEADNGVVY